MRTLDTRLKLSALLAVAAFFCAPLFAQKPAPQPEPALDAKIVRLRIGFSSGMCEGYCEYTATVEPGTSRRVTRSLTDK